MGGVDGGRTHCLKSSATTGQLSRIPNFCSMKSLCDCSVAGVMRSTMVDGKVTAPDVMSSETCTYPSQQTAGVGLRPWGGRQCAGQCGARRPPPAAAIAR
eukprot:scaffold80861_cov29-Tisochrysis_lutea.AAC.3